MYTKRIQGRKHQEESPSFIPKSSKNAKLKNFIPRILEVGATVLKAIKSLAPGGALYGYKTNNFIIK